MSTLKQAGPLTSAALSILLCVSGCTQQQQLAKEKGTTTAAVTTGKRGIEQSLSELAKQIQPSKPYGEQEIYQLLQDVLKNRNIFGAAWATPTSHSQANVYYVYVDGQSLVTRSDQGVDTADPAYAWFRKPLTTGSSGWSQPYQVEDHAGNRLTLVTYSLPAKLSNGTLIIACDYLIRREPLSSLNASTASR